MEYLEGQSLRERISSGGPLPLKAGLQLAGQLILALIHAHGKGIVHRDIKPDNVFVLNQSGVRLHTRVLDFGIARIFKRDDPSRVETITHAGAVLGTPRYMSPEQLAGQPVDARSDLYSAALVIFESLTGQIPYPGGQRLCELCPDATPALQELIEQCLKPNAAERPPTAVEVYLRLQELGKASGILLLPPGAMDRLVAARKASEPTVAYTPKNDGKLRRRVLIALGVIVALLALLALGWYLFFQGGGATDKGPAAIDGVKVGDSLAEVKAKLNLTRKTTGDPWGEKSKVKGHLGNVLAARDLGLSKEDLEHVVTHYNDDNPPTTLALFSGDRLVAVVSRDAHAKTNTGVKVGSREGDVSSRYGAGRTIRTTEDPREGEVDVWRYGELGVGYEIRNQKVIGMTLFPPAK
jgi:hypothetical protein